MSQSQIFDLLTNPTFTGGLSAAVGAIFGGIVTLIISRTSKPAEIQVAVNGAVTSVIDGFKTQLDDARKEIGRLSDKLDKASREITLLNNHVVDLNNVLHENGIKVPPRPSLDDDDGEEVHQLHLKLS